VFDHPRGLQKFEVDALTAAGFDIGTYYEENEQSILEGYSFGVRAGNNARQVWAACGQHFDVPLFLAADYDFTAGQLGPVYDALDGLASVIGRQNTGIYGGVVPVHLARQNGHATYAVQAGAWRYRAAEVGVTDPYGWSPLAQVRQDGYNAYVGGVNCDHLTALAVDFGQWRRQAVIAGPDVPKPSDVTLGGTKDPTNPAQFDGNSVVSFSSHGDLVATIQFILNTAFNANIPIKAPYTYDAATMHWVEVLQTYGKVKPTGIVQEETWHLLGSYVARLHRFDKEPVLKLNDVGHLQAVKDLQMALNAVTVHGYTPLVVDGNFNVKTLDCLVQYQRNRRLAPDGVCGRSTWNDLGALLTRYGK
jgi:peptidoglycan hydrolase-like protein with peptidoglycan-binding domain